MNDFETRARAAARAIHDAVDDTASLTVTPHKSHGPIRALAIAAIVTVIAVVGTTLVVNNRADGPASDVPTFCAQVQHMLTTPVDVVNGERTPSEPALAFLRGAPEEIRSTALAILRARTDHTSSATLPIEVTQRFLHWWQLRCYPDAATPKGGVTNQRDAPVPAPKGFEICGANNDNSVGTPALLRDEYGTIVVYGHPARSDPYDDRMIGIVRSPRQRYYSDDHAVPFPIPGHPGAELIDATGPFGAAIEGLGPAITWQDDRGFVSVVGRGYTRAQAADLAAIAAQVTEGSAGDELTDAGRGGLDVLYRGPVGEIYVQYPSPISATTFGMSYLIQPAGIVRLSGSVPGAGGVAATRFFAPGLRPARVGETNVLEGVVPVTNTAEGTTAHVVVWTDGDVMLTLTFDPRVGPTQESVDAFVAATHRLDRSEWERLLDAGNACLVAGSGESASASGSESSSVTTSTGPTSSTTATSTTTTLGR